MHKLIFFCSLLVSTETFAQITNSFYGLARKNTPTNEIYLASVNPTTGVVTNISPSSLSPIVNLTGAALDPYNNNYHFIGYNEIKTINLTSGLETNSVVINNPIANSYFDNFRFNNSDSTLYGLARRYIYDSITMTGYGEVFLATINTSTGTISQISPTSVAQGFALAGSAIDPYQKVFYFSGGTFLMGLDMYNGSVYSNVPIQLPADNYFDNFTYSCVDTALYGLIRTNYFDSIVSPFDSTVFIQILDSTAIRLGKIDPNTGIVTSISPFSIDQGGYSLNAGSAIDPATMTFYYNNGYDLIGVSMITGLKVSQQTLTNTNGQFFELMRIQSNCYSAKQPIRQNTSTSTIDISESTTIKLYPNPVFDELKIEAENLIKKIEVINMLGSLQISTFCNSKSLRLDVSTLPKGLYTIRCISQDQIYSLKFCKQ